MVVPPLSDLLPFRIPFPHRFADTNVIQDTTNGISPRVGMAWRPQDDARTVVRAAYGLFWGQVTGQDFINSGLQVPPGLIVDEQRSGSVTPQITFGAFNFGADPSTLIPTVPSFIIVPFGNNENPRVHQWNVGVERQIGSTFATSVRNFGALATSKNTPEMKITGRKTIFV